MRIGRVAAKRVSCAVLVIGLIGCGSGGAAAPDPSVANGSDASPIASEYFVSEYGVRVGVRVGFAEDRRLTGARLVWDGGSQEGLGLYPLDGTDPDVTPKTLDLPRGDQVLLEGNVLAACPDVPSLPVFEVQTIRAGQETKERFVPDQPAKFADAFAQWCELPLTVTLARARATPEGDCTYWLRLHNPGPSTVTAVSERVTGEGWVWEPGNAIVPAGTIGNLTIRGHGAPPGAPWESGHVLADGKPIAPGGGAATATVTPLEGLC